MCWSSTSAVLNVGYVRLALHLAGSRWLWLPAEAGRLLGPGEGNEPWRAGTALYTRFLRKLSSDRPGATLAVPFPPPQAVTAGTEALWQQAVPVTRWVPHLTPTHFTLTGFPPWLGPWLPSLSPTHLGPYSNLMVVQQHHNSSICAFDKQT